MMSLRLQQKTIERLKGILSCMELGKVYKLKDLQRLSSSYKVSLAKMKLLQKRGFVSIRIMYFSSSGTRFYRRKDKNLDELM